MIGSIPVQHTIQKEGRLKSSHPLKSGKRKNLQLRNVEFKKRRVRPTEVTVQTAGKQKQNGHNIVKV